MKRIFERQSAFFKTLLFCILLMFLLCTTRSWADNYTGTLKYGDGLVGASAWKSSTLKWTVDNNTHPGLWTYSYSFAVEAKEISHVIIEVAKGFGQQNLRGGTTPTYELGMFGQQGKSNPGIPGNICGMKWNTSGKALTYSWVIVTDRAPMWGDFYAKDGKHRSDWVFSYNSGFGSEPLDPTVREGNNGGWVLVPGVMTYHAYAVSSFALNTFKRIRGLVDSKDETKPKVAFVGSHVKVTSEYWAYVLDNTGEQIFRPKASYPHLKESFSNDIGPMLSRWIHEPVSQTKIDEAKRLALSMVGVDYLKNSEVKAILVRELIASKSADSDIKKHYEGRTMVLFSPPTPNDKLARGYSTSMTYTPDRRTTMKVTPIDLPREGYETAIIFTPSGNLMRMETGFLTSEVQNIVAVFREGLKNGSIKGQMYGCDPDIRFGAFFNPDEWRFETIAFSWEGTDFVTTNEPWCVPDYYPLCNPYYLDWFPELYPCLTATSPDFSQLWTTSLYHFDYWDWWYNTGRKNGIRGNWDPSTQSWEIPGYDVIHHKNLKSYGITGSHGPTDWDHCDGIQTHDHPYGGGKKLDQTFYNDLEQNHVAVISTHGGMAFCNQGLDFYQFLKEHDLWVSLHREGDNGLGQGSLRHLFLATCSSMNWNHGPKHGELQNLFSDWMNWHVANGVRTICGADGVLAGMHMNGLVFFDHYHKGESVSQAWFNMLLKECTCNVPVIIAYGSTEDEAAANLFDGRFTKERGGTGWIIAAELVTEHLITHQACCVPGGTCIDAAYEECKDPTWVKWYTGGLYEIEGTPMGENTQCGIVCPIGQDNKLCIQ